jgi:hypothetical protein
MKKIVFLLFIFGAVLACKKNSSPRKIDRIIVGNDWKLEKFIDANVNYSEVFKNYVYTVNDSKEFISAGPDSTVRGSWDTQDRKNPAVFIINLPVTVADSALGDDWNVVYLAKDEFRLERLNGQKHPNDECIFKKK